MDFPISGLELASYEKELERYGSIGISTAERLFCLSTRLVLKTIRNFEKECSIPVVKTSNRSDETGRVEDDLSFRKGSESSRLIAGVLHLNATFQAAGFEPNEVMNFCKNIFNQLFKRLNINKELRIKYDQDYRKMSTNLTGFFDKQVKERSQDEYYDVLAESLHDLNHYIKYQVLIDLNHVHLNRLFPHDPNYQEALCYYYLCKQLIRQTKTSQGSSDRK